MAPCLLLPTPCFPHQAPPLDPGHSSACLPVPFGVPGAWLGPDALRTPGPQAAALLPQTQQLPLGLQRAQSPLCLSFSVSPGSLPSRAPVGVLSALPLGNVRALAGSVSSARSLPGRCSIETSQLWLSTYCVPVPGPAEAYNQGRPVSFVRISCHLVSNPSTLLADLVSPRLLPALRDSFSFLNHPCPPSSPPAATSFLKWVF